MRDLQSLSVSSANGAPLHLIRFERSARSRQAQVISMLTHGVAVLAILYLAAQVSPNPRVPIPKNQPPNVGILSYPLPHNEFGDPSLGLKGGSGNHDPETPKGGMAPAFSSAPLAPPRIPNQTNPQLPVPVALLDPESPEFPAPITRWGSPSRLKDSDSPGPGEGKGVGRGKGQGVGDGDGDGAGQGNSSGRYSNVLSRPACAYCPDPQYTDEAREVKMQGSVTLLALVGADGRAAEIRLERGLGYGLDERAIQTVRTWRFVPARDGARRPVPAWVTIEAVYRLF